MINKQDIRNRACHIFAYKGFHETTTDNIACSLGLKKQSLYSHYKSKNEIITDVLKEQFSIITVSLDKTINILRDTPVENLLRGIFESVVAIFSDYERLLLWKRIHLILYSEEYTDLLDGINWQFIGRLKDKLHAIICVQYTKFTDPDIFKMFFYTYSMMIRGYLDWMLLSRHNDQYFLALWHDYWNGIKYKFECFEN